MEQNLDQSTTIEEKPNSFFSQLKQSIKEYSSQNPLFFLFLLLMIPLTLIALQQTISYLSKAQTASTVNVSFSPTTINLPPQTTVKIMFDSQTKKVAFARVVFTFNPNKIKLASEISTNPNLSTTVQKSSQVQSNTQGKAIIVIAASPTDTQPQGNYEFASFSLTNVSQTANDSSTITLDTADMQIVEGGGTVLNPLVQPLTIALNKSTTGGSSPTVILPSPTQLPQVGNPSTACQVVGSPPCYNQWLREYTGVDTTKFADLNKDLIVNLIDFEVWRRAALP